MTGMINGMSDQQKSLGERVSRARIDRDWSKEEAARRAGISAITWKRIEDGLNVHDGKLAAALRTLGIDQPAPPEGVFPIGDTDDGLVEFSVEGAHGVRAVVKGPVRDLDALQAAVSRLIAGMQGGSTEEQGH